MNIDLAIKLLMSRKHGFLDREGQGKGNDGNGMARPCRGVHARDEHV